MKNYILLLLSLLSLSCSKVIDVEYQEIEPIYVVQSVISDEGSYLRLTQSANMEEQLQPEGVETAQVSVVSEDGKSFELEYYAEGYYLPYYPQKLTEGKNYTLNLEVEGQTFSSTALLPSTPVISDVIFSQQQFTADMNLVFCTVAILDTPGQENYYRYRFRYFVTDEVEEESGEEPSWSLLKEDVDGEKVWVMTHLYTPDRELEDGDEITVEVQSISRGAYEFFYTLSLSGSSSTNPSSNIDGGCIGYFSPYSVASVTKTFYYGEL